MKKLLIAIAILTVSAAEAKTVALWPMEKDEIRNTANMRCAISSANGFSTVPSQMTFEATTIGWNLPPNPDPTAGKLFSVTSYWDFVSDPTATDGTAARNLFRVDTPELSELLKLRHDFTLEGWLKPWAVQDKSWHIIFQSNGGGDAGYFSWMIRNDKEDANGNSILGFYLYSNSVGLGDTLIGPAFSTEEAIELTNSWHHIALSFDAKDLESPGLFTLYYDGVLRGTVTAKNICADFTPNYTYQTFGGRIGGQLCLARWNYWRLSDNVLTVEDLLCYGGTGTVVSKPETPQVGTTATIGYWKLGADADGYIDGHDYVGDCDLSRGFLDYTDGKASIELLPARSTVAASADKPFVQPPNTTVTIPNGLRGSFRGGGNWSGILIEGPGTDAELDNDFTVEGYVRFLQNEGWTARYSYGDGYIFGTASAVQNNHWVLRYVRDSHTLCIYIAGYLSAEFCVAPTDTAWHHLALVYDSTANARSWTLYLDGVKTKTVSLTQTAPAVSEAKYFCIAGRGGPDDIPCELSCVRLSKTQLATDQFLCERTSPKAATNVLALWPLDTPDGATLDGRDVVGSYSFTHGAFDGSAYQLSSVADDQPVIANPERKLGVYSHPGAQPNGAVRFRNGDDGKKSFLCFVRSALAEKLRGMTTEWTVEFYTKRAAAPATKNPGDLIFAVMSLSSTEYIPATNSGQLTVAYGKNGFAVYDYASSDFRTQYNHYTVACEGTADAIPLNEWAHVAVTRACANGIVTYTFYVNGVKKGEMSGTLDNATAGDCTFFGGCYNLWNSECAWNGLWSSLRLTADVLDPADFLCATPASPVPAQEVETLAYWPFDYRNTALDLLSRSVYQYTPFKTDYAKVVGSSEQALGRLDNPATALPIPLARNHGSASVARGAPLTYPGLAEKLSYNRAFTVEGWIKWTSAATAKTETLFAAEGSSGVTHGWRLYVDYSGTVPALKLYGTAPSGECGAVIGDTLVSDISSWSGVWKHVALVYDPAEGNCGTWKLYVDRTLAGTLGNVWYPGLTPWLQGDFAIGAADATSTTGFTGLLDEWRVVTKALTQDELLKESRQGIVLILR